MVNYILSIIILTILIGPNIEVLGYEIYYWFFFLFIIYAFGKRVVAGGPKLDYNILYFIPGIMALFSFITKVLTTDIILKDFLDFVRYISLGLVFYATVYSTIKLNSIKVERLIRTVVYIIFGVTLFNSVIALLQYLNVGITTNQIFKILYESDIRWGMQTGYTNFFLASEMSRVTAIYNSPIALGGFLAYFNIFIVSFKKRYLDKYFLLLFLTSFSAFILTNARAAIISFIIGLIIYLIINKEIKLLIISFAVSLIIFFVILQYLTLQNLIRFEELYDLFANGIIPSTIEARFIDIAKIWTHMQNESFIISGVPWDYFNTYLWYVSWGSQYFNWFVKYGIWGLGIILWLFYMLFYYWRKYLQESDHLLKDYLFSIVLILTVSVFLGITQSSTLNTRWREFFFIYMGLVYTYQYRIKNEIVPRYKN